MKSIETKAGTKYIYTVLGVFIYNKKSHWEFIIEIGSGSQKLYNRKVNTVNEARTHQLDLDLSTAKYRR